MKKIVIGIDISKEKIDATAIDIRNIHLRVNKLDYQVFENRPMGFRRMLVWARHLAERTELQDVLFCCETTGGYDRVMCDYLYAKGLDIWRESALQIKLRSGLRRGKDDKADSLVIAEYAMRYMDKAVMYQSPSETIRELKALLLYRHKLTQEKTAKKVRMAQLKETAAKSKSMTFILRDARKGIKMLEKSIKECEKQIQEVFKSDEDLQRSYNHLKSIRGVAIVNATAMIAYSNNFKNITTANKMATYYGVARFRKKSGTSIDKKDEVKQYSSSMLRAYLTQAAECTIEEHGIYHDYYIRKKAEGKPYGVILNNIKNKLIHLAFSLIENDIDYEENHEFLRAQKRNTNENISI